MRQTGGEPLLRAYQSSLPPPPSFSCLCRVRPRAAGAREVAYPLAARLPLPAACKQPALVARPVGPSHVLLAYRPVLGCGSTAGVGVVGGVCWWWCGGSKDGDGVGRAEGGAAPVRGGRWWWWERGALGELTLLGQDGLLALWLTSARLCAVAGVGGGGGGSGAGVTLTCCAVRVDVGPPVGGGDSLPAPARAPRQGGGWLCLLLWRGPRPCQERALLVTSCAPAAPPSRARL